MVKLNRFNLPLYGYDFSPGKRSVSMWDSFDRLQSVSCLPCGDHAIELYSSKGRTCTLKARTSISISRDTKLCKIAFAGVLYCNRTLK